MRADGRTDRQRDSQTDMTKPMVAFLIFANAPKTVLQLFYKCSVKHVLS